MRWHCWQQKAERQELPLFPAVIRAIWEVQTRKIFSIRDGLREWLLNWMIRAVWFRRSWKRTCYYPIHLKVSNRLSICSMRQQRKDEIGCLTGSFCIPKLLDVQGSRYRILFFILKGDKTPISIGGTGGRWWVFQKTCNQNQTQEEYKV